MYIVKTAGRRGPNRAKTYRDMLWCVGGVTRCEDLDSAVDLMIEAFRDEVSGASQALTIWDLYGRAA
jgi:hypothetical protein